MALQPAKVKDVVLDEDSGTATVIVNDYQLSLAIGKEGQNARLAARLTGWRIDIKSESQLAEEEAYAAQEWAEGEWVENEVGEMVWQPAEGGEAVSAEEWEARSSAEPGEEAAEGRPAERGHAEQTGPVDGASAELAGTGAEPPAAGVLPREGAAGQGPARRAQQRRAGPHRQGQAPWSRTRSRVDAVAQLAAQPDLRRVPGQSWHR